MTPNFSWIDGPWPGKVAVAARPRGGDWLNDELSGWRRVGVDSVLSLLTPGEEADLDLRDEAATTRAHGMKFVSFPIPDREVPNSESELASVLDRVDKDLSSGKNVLVHCRQGIGRSGLVAACLLVSRGIAPEKAIDQISTARGLPVPETSEQRNWISHYAAVLPRTK